MRELADRPEDVPAVFAERFNSGDATALAEVYEDGAVLVEQSGTPVTGPALLAANGRLQNLGVPVSVRPRHVYRNGDLALLIVDWAIDGTDRDGEAVHVEGTATDVARRGPDGRCGTPSTTPSVSVRSRSPPRTPQIRRPETAQLVKRLLSAGSEQTTSEVCASTGTVRPRPSIESVGRASLRTPPEASPPRAKTPCGPTNRCCCWKWRIYPVGRAASSCVASADEAIRGHRKPVGTRA
ncbi:MULTISPECIES: DUF4440 domain-containing protein [unclassified Streptomyces]|uniref:YybH family protein n=1 Tax=unclassified Streptomyces TaxID=2593676 RepID=UPI002B1CEE00|nr:MULTISPECIES: DUF4440 domain-containing protein [unclassified Streptomyces]